MQNSLASNSVTKPKLRKSLRLRKKIYSNKIQNKKLVLSRELLSPRQDPTDTVPRSRSSSPSPPEDQASHPIKSRDDNHRYSLLLLELCNKLVKENEAYNRMPTAASASMKSKEKRVPLYSPLTHDSLLYPYANLLLGLHKKVSVSDYQASKQQRLSSSPDRSLSRVLNDLDHPIDPSTNEYKTSCDTNTTISYTKKMQNFVILEALRKTILGECEGLGSGCADHSAEGATVGEVMSNLGGQQRPRALYPSDEFYYSSLLLKACSAQRLDQSPDVNLGSDDGRDTDSHTSTFSDNRFCSTASNSSDSYEEWSPSYRKRKVKKVRRRRTKSRMGERESFSQAVSSPCKGRESNIHQNNAPTLLKLLLSKESSYEGAGKDTLPHQPRSPPPTAADSGVASQGPAPNGLQGSLLKNFLSKPSDEFQKYYSKIRETKENSARTSLHNDTDRKCLRGQSSSSTSTSLSLNKVKREASSIPALIPCSLLSDTNNPSCVVDTIKSEAGDIDVGCPFLEEDESKPAPQAMSLTVASMLCRLKLYPSGEGGAGDADLIDPCTASVSSVESKQGLGSGDAGRCGSEARDAALEEHQCSLCHLPFVSSLDLQCHQSLFHASHSSSEKVRN